MLGRDGFQAMRKAHPNGKLIFLLRNPADRFWSSIKFNRTHNPNFDIEVMFDRLLEREDFMLLADYSRTLTEVLSVFEPERVHVEFYERLFTQQAVNGICRFAGIQERAAEFSGRSNPSIDGAMPENRRVQAVRAYAHIYRAMEEQFRADLPESWRQDLDRFTG